MGRYSEHKAVVEAEDRASPYGDGFSAKFERHAGVIMTYRINRLGGSAVRFVSGL